MKYILRSTLKLEHITMIDKAEKTREFESILEEEFVLDNPTTANFANAHNAHLIYHKKAYDQCQED